MKLRPPLRWFRDWEEEARPPLRPPPLRWPWLLRPLKQWIALTILDAAAVPKVAKYTYKISIFLVIKWIFSLIKKILRKKHCCCRYSERFCNPSCKCFIFGYCRNHGESTLNESKLRRNSITSSSKNFDSVQIHSQIDSVSILYWRENTERELCNLPWWGRGEFCKGEGENLRPTSAEPRSSVVITILISRYITESAPAVDISSIMIYLGISIDLRHLALKI
jgi:hypothetical protein